MCFTYNFYPRAVGFYTSIFRGIPLILQLAIIFYGSYSLGLNLEVWQAGLVTFSLNSTAYLTEILKSGTKTVSYSEIFSAKSLGISQFKITRDIIMPQAIQNSFNSILNELVDLIKESSIISTISGFDLMRRANIVAAETYSYFTPYFTVGLIYYVVVTLLSYAISKHKQ